MHTGIYTSCIFIGMLCPFSCLTMALSPESSYYPLRNPYACWRDMSVRHLRYWYIVSVYRCKTRYGARRMIQPRTFQGQSDETECPTYGLKLTLLLQLYWLIKLHQLCRNETGDRNWEEGKQPYHVFYTLHPPYHVTSSTIYARVE